MGYEYSLCLLPQFWVGRTPPFPLHLTLTSNLTLRDALFWFNQLKNRKYHIQVMLIFDIKKGTNPVTATNSKKIPKGTLRLRLQTWLPSPASWLLAGI